MLTSLTAADLTFVFIAVVVGLCSTVITVLWQIERLRRGPRDR
ncbi:MAG: hypothetical protein P4M07_08515 [Xanthobacteraceae bacterium]|nr:hypothetical protein [Xanthobacteraceae bacterium]